MNIEIMTITGILSILFLICIFLLNDIQLLISIIYLLISIGNSNERNDAEMEQDDTYQANFGPNLKLNSN